MKRRIVLTIKELKIQIILLIISIFLICKFSSAPLLFKWMAFFLRPQEETMGFELFRIMESLSLAYIASLIFYLVRRKQKKRHLSYLNRTLFRFLCG